MPDFIVKTSEGRNIVIAAERYSLDRDTAVYNFFKDGETVGSVNAHAVLAVLDFDDAFRADFFNDSDEDETGDPCDGSCLDCRLEDFSKSETFFDSVNSILDFYFNTNDEAEPAEAPACGCCPVPSTPTAVPDQVNEPLAKVEFRNYDGYPSWGVSTENRFIPFGDSEAGRASAEENAANYTPGSWTGWCSSSPERVPVN